MAHAASFLTNFDHPTELIKTTSVDEVFKLASYIQKIFKNEFLNQINIDQIQNKKQYLEDLRLFKIEGETVSIHWDLKVRFLKDLL